MKYVISVVLICVFLIYSPLAMSAEASTGTVAETIDSGGYIYIRLEEGDVWLATSPVKVAVGDKIQYGGGAEMRDFESKSLDRTFESIFFVQGVQIVGDVTDNKAANAGHGGDAMPMSKPRNAEAPVSGEVKPLSDGKTIAAVYDESAQLKEQTIRLNAKVIKINKAIMGRNWVTLQDGTGVEPNNKLLVTTQEVVSPGDIVTVEGVINTDIDLGYGYIYAVLLEEATFKPVTE